MGGARWDLDLGVWLWYKGGALGGMASPLGVSSSRGGAFQGAGLMGQMGEGSLKGPHPIPTGGGDWSPRRCAHPDGVSI